MRFEIGSWIIYFLARDIEIYDGKKEIIPKRVFDSGTLLSLYHRITDEGRSFRWNTLKVSYDYTKPYWWKKDE